MPLNPFLLLAIFSMAVAACGTPFKALERAGIPNRGDLILLSGPTLPEDHPEAFRHHADPLFFRFESRTLYALESPTDGGSPSPGEALFAYRTFLYARNGSRSLLVPEAERPRSNSHGNFYPFPRLRPGKDAFAIPRNEGIGIYDLRGVLMKEIHVGTLVQNFGWLDRDHLYVLDNLEPDTTPYRAWVPRKGPHTVLRIHLTTGAKTALFQGERIGEVRFNRDGTRLATTHWNEAAPKGEQAFVQVVEVKTGRALARSKGLPAIRQIAWSPTGKLAVVHEMAVQGYAPSTVALLDDNGDLEDLLNLPVKTDAPGFFWGDGYRGVTEMAWSPDGDRFAYLASQPGGCRMADEGGNIRCRLDLYVFDLATRTRQAMKIPQGHRWHALDWIRLP